MKAIKARLALFVVVAASSVVASIAAAHDMGTTGAATAAVSAASASNDVSISGFSFQPAVLVVKAGTKVTWTNRDSSPHTVTSTDQRFASSAGLDSNDRYSYVFDKPGTYTYFCSLHPMMVGKVKVEPAG